MNRKDEVKMRELLRGYYSMLKCRLDELPVLKDIEEMKAYKKGKIDAYVNFIARDKTEEERRALVAEAWEKAWENYRLEISVVYSNLNVDESEPFSVEVRTRMIEVCDAKIAEVDKELAELK